MATDYNEGWVTIARFGTMAEASIARGVLEGAGIDVHVMDEASVGVAPYLPALIGGVRLQVRAEDVEVAKQLLVPVDETPS